MTLSIYSLCVLGLYDSFAKPTNGATVSCLDATPEPARSAALLSRAMNSTLSVNIIPLSWLLKSLCRVGYFLNRYLHVSALNFVDSLVYSQVRI